MSRSSKMVIAIIGAVGKTDVSQLIASALSDDYSCYQIDARVLDQTWVALENAVYIYEADHSLNSAARLNPDITVIMPELNAQVSTMFIDSVKDDGVIITSHKLSADIMRSVKRKNLKLINVGLYKNSQNDNAHDTFIENVACQADCSCVMANMGGEKIAYKISLAGIHAVLNSLVALTVVKVVGGDLAMSAISFANQKMKSGHGREVVLGLDGRSCILVDYSNGLNSLSLEAALDHVSLIKSGKYSRRIAVLGKSSGPLGDGLVKNLLEAGISRILTTDSEMASYMRRKNMIAEKFEVNATLQTRIKSMVRPGDVVLLMANASSNYRQILDGLTSHFETFNHGLKTAAE